MKNVVVIYSGREGSSAIVSSLGKHSKISLPIFEHMDFSNIKNKFGNSVFDKVHIGIGNLLAGCEFGENIFDEEPSCDYSSKKVVFKWRPWGDMEKISSVLKKNKTLLVSLARRDVVNHGLSKYFTNRVVGEGKGFYHPQFHVNKLSEEEKSKYIKKLRESCFNVDIDLYVKDLKEYVDAKQIMHNKVNLMRKRGVDVKEVFYEDFLEDKERFLSSLLFDIGLDYEDDVARSDFKKVNRNDLRDQVENIIDVENDCRVKSLVSKYHNLFF